MADDLVIHRIDAWVYRQPIEQPVATSFGIMRDRPAVFIRIEDQDGAYGWGESFANWPVAGAEHRARLLMSDIADLVIGTRLGAPSELFEKLSFETHVRALQCGEWGPFRQVIAGLDIAAWDLFARRAQQPVSHLLNPAAVNHVPVYASGIDIRRAPEMIPVVRKQGFTRFKVKVGFDLKTDADAVNKIAFGLAPDEKLFTDANQKWTRDDAEMFISLITDSGVGWLEEPMLADVPTDEWLKLFEHSPIPLAGGENISGREDFTRAIDAGALQIIQPDIAKWGGFTGCFDVAREALAAERMYCPHYLGGGIGLAASAHILAAAGGPGYLEVDVNPNATRDAFRLITDAVSDGMWRIEDGVGLGIDAVPNELEQFLTYSDFRTI